MKFSDQANYRSLLRHMYHVLYKSNVGVDFVFPESTNFANYRVIVVPPLYVAGDALLNKLVDYVRNGGHVLMAFKSGFTNEYDTVRWTTMPGPLREAAGFHYQEFSSLRQPLALKGDPFHVGDENKVSDWAEMITLDSAEGVAYYDHPFFGKYPAITRHALGKGSLTYEGTVVSDALQTKVLLDVLQRAGISGPDQSLPGSVRAKHGVNRNGRKIHYYLNYSSQEQTFGYSYGAGTELLTRTPVAPSQKITVQPWDLILVEEK
jgi:beta-galactosidase